VIFSFDAPPIRLYNLIQIIEYVYPCLTAWRWKTVLENYRLQAKIFKALMHPARLAILNALQDGEQCVCHLEAVLGCRQAYISQHLSVLRDAGLVQDRRDGWNIFYGVGNSKLFDLLTMAAELSGIQAAGRQPAPKSAGCPCPKCNPQEPGALAAPVEALALDLMNERTE